MSKISSPELVKMNELRKYYISQQNKKFNYTLDDFEIYDSQWKHKDWKTWCKGANNYSETKEIVKKYISECAKPYGKRNISFVHLINDN